MPTSDYYSRNKEHIKKVVTERRNKIKDWFKEYKATLKCEVCGEDHPACLEFHHPGDDKEKDISLMLRDENSIETILAEIKKCDVLCANCHRKEHHKTQGA